MSNIKKIAVFASGSGSNAESIVKHFAGNAAVSVELFLTNNAAAGVIKRGRRLGIPTIVFSKKSYSESDQVIKLLQNQEIDLVVLAGFLWLIPATLIAAYPNKIINIHPALLPKHGGKGMWGHHVHEAVVAQKDSESGITIHYVNEKYDEGGIIFQAKCPVSANESPEQVAANVLKLEHEHFPKVIAEVLAKL